MLLLVLLKTVRTYLLGAVVSLFFMPLALLLSLIPEGLRFNRFYYFVTYIWNRLLLFFTFTLIKIEGAENLPSSSSHPVIFVMNHSSALDISIGEYVAGSRPHLWISKMSYGRIPFGGFLLRRMYVLVDRKNHRDVIKALVRALNLAKTHNLDIILFPEGTRSNDGKVGKFLDGFSLFAKKLQRPVIPVAIKGANKIMPKNSWIINARASDVKLIIGKPFIMKKDEKERDFSLRVQKWFEGELG